MTETSEEKEKLLVEFLLSSKELFIKCGGILNPEYFDTPLDSVVQFALDYVHKYHDLPDTSIVKAETDVKLKKHEITSAEAEYITDEIEKHCQVSAMRMAILTGADILGEDDDEPDFGKINNMVRDALMVSIDKDMGIDYFGDPAMRLLQMQEHIDTTPIGYPSIDMITEGCRRGELVLFAGASGSGKSVMLANIAQNMMESGKRGIVISLELGADLISKRMDSIITGVETKDIYDSISDIVSILGKKEKTYGECFVKKMPVKSSSNDIRAYLTEFEIQFGYKPDFICVDYLDRMGTNQKITGNAFDVDDAKTEELREIGVDYNAFMFSASQLNRDSVDTVHKTHAHIAGGLSKINVSDVVWAIIRNEEEIDNDEIHLQALKLRNSEFSTKPIALHWCSKTLRISELHGHKKISKSNPVSNSSNPSELQQILDRQKKKKK